MIKLNDLKLKFIFSNHHEVMYIYYLNKMLKIEKNKSNFVKNFGFSQKN